MRPRDFTGMLVIAGAFITPAGAMETSFDVDAGYRTDALRWSIAADSSGTATANILSELTRGYDFLLRRHERHDAAERGRMKV